MANANIKISQLPNIGSNLDGNTLLPVVSTNGTYLTDKVTVGNLANYILDEAGNLLNTAFVSQLALNVVNSAQPNITSVGDLTGLTITNFSNIHFPGGENGYYLQTDGNGNLSWVAGGGSGNGEVGGSDTQIQFNNSGLFGGDAGLTWVNGNVVANGIKTDNYFYANGDPFVGGNTGNIGFDNNIIYSLAGLYLDNSDLAHDATAAVIIPANGAGNLDINNTYGNIRIQTGTTGLFTSSWTFDTDGYISAPYGNLGQAAGETFGVTAGPDTAAVIQSNSGVHTWTFGENGNLTYPDNTTTTGSSIRIQTGNTFSITTASSIAVSAACYISNGDEFVADTEFNDDITVVQVGWTVVIDSTTYTVTSIDPAPPANQYRITAAGATFVQGTTYTFTDPLPATHTWSIDQYGVLTTPGSGTISQINNDFMIAVAGTDIIGLRTEGGDVIVDAAGNVNIPGQLVSTTSVSRLSLNEQGNGGAYLTSTDNDSTALFLRTNDVQMYAGINQTILSGTILPGLETDYTDSRIILEDLFTQNSGEAGYPWGITLPVSYLTYNELILLAPDTFPNQVAVTTQANNTTNLYELWQQTISETNVTVTANDNSWVFDGLGNLTLPGNTFSINYANGTQVPVGTISSLVNGDNSFVLNSDGNVVFEGLAPGDGVDRGLVWDYGANQGGLNSQVRQDMNGITVRAWTELGGGANGYSAPVRIVTNQDATENIWTFSGQGNLTLPGNLLFAAGNIQSNTITPAFNSTLANINSGNANVIVTIANEVFEGPVSGQVTISSVNAPAQINGAWWYQAVDLDQFQLFTDSGLTTPVDGSLWPAYDGGGGTVVGSGIYSNLTVQGGNVTIGSDSQTWTFGSDGLTTLPEGAIIDTTGNNFEVRAIENVNFEANAVVNIYTDTSNNGWQWQFDDSGSMIKPNSVVDNSTSTVICNPNVSTIIYTATRPYNNTIKLIIQAEGSEISGQPWDTHACEMLVVRGYRTTNVVGSVYGLVYTSTNPLATFNATLNVTTGKIEVTCIPTSTTDSVYVRTTATELQTSD